MIFLSLTSAAANCPTILLRDFDGTNKSYVCLFYLSVFLSQLSIMLVLMASHCSEVISQFFHLFVVHFLNTNNDHGFLKIVFVLISLKNILCKGSFFKSHDFER